MIRLCYTHNTLCSCFVDDIKVSWHPYWRDVKFSYLLRICLQFLPDFINQYIIFSGPKHHDTTTKSHSFIAFTPCFNLWKSLMLLGVLVLSKSTPRQIVYQSGITIGHGNEYPIMHRFGFPRHTQSMLAQKTVTEYFSRFRWKIALWEYSTVRWIPVWLWDFSPCSLSYRIWI